MKFMTLDTDILIIILCAIVIALAALVVRLEIKLRRLLHGKSGSDLESTIVELSGGLRELETFKKKTEEYFKSLEERVRRSSQGIETIRFNAFKGDGTGGNQSFATAIVSENGDGVVLSSIYSRDRMSVFAKPLRKFSSEIELTEEEAKALGGAREQLKQKK